MIALGRTMSATHTMIASQTMIAFGKLCGDHIIVTRRVSSLTAGHHHALPCNAHHFSISPINWNLNRFWHDLIFYSKNNSQNKIIILKGEMAFTSHFVCTIAYALCTKSVTFFVGNRKAIDKGNLFLTRIFNREKKLPL